MKDCAWCGLPLEAVTRWTSKERTYVPGSGEGITTTEKEMTTARCLNGHWYGGPAADVEEE